MIPLDISFGIFAFMPLGWAFMIFVILFECIIATKILIGKTWHKKIWLTIFTSNFISGLTGILLSLKLNGGSWLVVWFPWISKHEVNIHNPQALLGLIIYYLSAFVLTLLIEFGINYLFLRKPFGTKSIIKMTLLTNIASYTVGSAILYGISFT